MQIHTKLIRDVAHITSRVGLLQRIPHSPLQLHHPPHATTHAPCRLLHALPQWRTAGTAFSPVGWDGAKRNPLSAALAGERRRLGGGSEGVEQLAVAAGEHEPPPRRGSDLRGKSVPPSGETTSHSAHRGRRYYYPGYRMWEGSGNGC